MIENRTHSLGRIGRSIYPFRIIGFTLFAISIFLSQSKLGLNIDVWTGTGIVICLIYPHVVLWRYLKNEKREVEIKHMLIDMGFQGIMAALVNFTPSIVLPYLIANSAANYALRGIKQTIIGVLLAISTAVIVGFLRNESIVYHANPIELLGPFIYLIAVTHYMGYLAYVRGIALIHRSEKAVKLAHQDFLTGLNNRRRMFDLARSNDEKRQISSADTTLIMIDLDHFKQINDQHGHDHGDAVLIQVSELFKSGLRKFDIVARWGGEEFLILLPETKIKEGFKLAEKIRQNIANHSINHNGIDHHVTATFGISSYHTESTFEETLQRADKALYQGKQLGRNRVVLINN
jgi:diguanylate cyclase (GGDEF)-like protein